METERTPRVPMGRTATVALFLVFFVLAAGLGYPTLNRYDPTVTPATVDSKTYVDIVEKGPRAADDSHRRFRVLVPFLARPVRDLVDGRLENWDETLFALLIVNAAFVAAAGALLVWVASHLGPGSVLAGFLLLINPVVPNFHLAGLTDSAELFGFVLLTALLFKRQWSWIPILGVLSLAKETFYVMGVVYAALWYVATFRREGLRPIAVGALAGFGLIGSASVMLIRRSIDGYWIWPWEVAESLQISPSLMEGLRDQFAQQILYFTFGWLVLLALPRLRAQLGAWLVAAWGSAAIAIFLGAWAGAGGNVVRPLYAVLGPLLCFSAAQLFVRWESPEGVPAREPAPTPPRFAAGRTEAGAS